MSLAYNPLGDVSNTRYINPTEYSSCNGFISAYRAAAPLLPIPKTPI